VESRLWTIWTLSAEEGGGHLKSQAARHNNFKTFRHLHREVVVKKIKRKREIERERERERERAI
jgi:hypothetical protein